jgi:AraC-like DNA-binding protein
MTPADSYVRFVMARIQPSLQTSGVRLYWDGRSAATPDLASILSAGPGTQAVVPGSTRKKSLVSRALQPAIDWRQAAAGVTFYLDPSLLAAAARGVISGATGELVWVREEEAAASMPPVVRPALLVPDASDARQATRVELVPYLPACDPLRRHIALVLQATSTADDTAGRLYAEALAHALAVHFLRRYAACRLTGQVVLDGLSPAKLRRIIAYIQEHLAEELPLATLAAVVPLSRAHFARLFKQATGRTPHQYVLHCRLERAKQLLAETTLPLGEIACQVGCADHSHLTALFRQYVGLSPKAYRAATQRP